MMSLNSFNKKFSFQNLLVAHIKKYANIGILIKLV